MLNLFQNDLTWEDEYQYLLGQIRMGEIEVDNNLYFIDSDGLTMLVRGDLLPVSLSMSEEQIEVMA